MKTKLTLVAALSLVTFNAFAQQVPHESGSRRAPMAVEVSYVSIGTGIDSEVKAAIDDLLISKKFGRTVEYIKESGWGLEGESTLCIQFHEFSEASATYGEILQVMKDNGATYTTAVMKLDCNPLVVPKPNE